MRVLMWPTAAALRRKRAPPARPRSTRRRECAASGSQLVVSLAVEDGDLRPAPRRRAAASNHNFRTLTIGGRWSAACADVSGIASWPEPRSDRIAHGRPWASSARPART
jgi:hypothetical protein